MAQIALCHLPGPFWICHDTKIRPKKKTLVSFTGDFLPNFDLKNMILTPYKGFFHGKNRPKIKKNFQIPRVL